MENKFFTIDLHCDITGVKLGEVQLSTRDGWGENITEAEYKQATGIVDMRSPAAEAKHGTYKEMVAEYTQKTFGKSVESAEEFIKKNRTREAFDKELGVILKKK